MALRLFLARHRVHFIHVGPIHKYQHRALFVPDELLRERRADPDPLPNSTTSDQFA